MPTAEKQLDDNINQNQGQFAWFGQAHLWPNEISVACMDKIPAWPLVQLPERAGEEKDDTAALAPRGLPPLDDEDF